MQLTVHKIPILRLMKLSAITYTVGIWEDLSFKEMCAIYLEGVTWISYTSHYFRIKCTKHFVSINALSFQTHMLWNLVYAIWTTATATWIDWKSYRISFFNPFIIFRREVSYNVRAFCHIPLNLLSSQFFNIPIKKRTQFV